MNANSESSTLRLSGTRTSAPPISEKTVISHVVVGEFGVVEVEVASRP